jgi:succinoglycan biosynthesis transport protein ExoP
MIETFEPDMDFEARSNDLDVGALGSAIYRKRYWILVPTLLGFLLAALFVTVVKPRYTAEAEVLLENQENFLTSTEHAELQQATPEGQDTELVGSQIQLVTSTDLARRVIERLGLIGNPEFDPYSKGVGVISEVLVLSGLMRDPMRIPAEDRVLATFEDRLSVYSPPKTRVLVIQFYSRDPVLAARIANEIATLYLEMQAGAKREIAQSAAGSLAEQITDLKARVARGADEVERYRATSGLLAGTNNMTITGQALADLSGDLSRARTSQADSQAKAALIRDMLRQGRISEVPDVANNDLIRRIAEQGVTARAQLALESGTLLPKHPRIRELNSEIADLDIQLRTAAENIARALENDSKIAAARVANLEAAIEEQKKAVVVADTDEVHLHELERAAQALRDQLDSSLTKYQEALAAENSTSTPADARVIARATPPDEPSFPKKVPTLVFGTVANFVLSLGAVIGSELFSERAQPVSSTVQPRPVRQAPSSNFERAVASFKRFARLRRDAAIEDLEMAEGVDEEDVESGEDDAAAKIAARASHAHGVHIVATSLCESDAANAALIGFARNLAREGRPIIIDLNAGAGQVAPLFGTEPRPEKMMGLTDLLEGEASFADVIHRDCASRLHFVPFGSAESFDPDDLDIILDALAQTYDFVVLAAPPLATSEMPKALAPYADFVVLAEPAENDEASTKAARAELSAAGAAEILVVSGAEEMAPSAA